MAPFEILTGDYPNWTFYYVEGPDSELEAAEFVWPLGYESGAQVERDERRVTFVPAAKVMERLALATAPDSKTAPQERPTSRYLCVASPTGETGLIQVTAEGVGDGEKSDEAAETRICVLARRAVHELGSQHRPAEERFVLADAQVRILSKRTRLRNLFTRGDATLNPFLAAELGEVDYRGWKKEREQSAAAPSVRRWSPVEAVRRVVGLQRGGGGPTARGTTSRRT